MEKMDNVVGLLLLGVILFVLRGGVSGTVCSNQHYYSTASDAVKVTPMSTTSASSLAFCASICTRQSSCRYFRWTYQTSQCSLFRAVTRNETGQLAIGLTEKQRCSGSRKENSNGVCHCANGLYGPDCDTQFQSQLHLLQEYSVFMARDVDQMEHFNRSNLVLTSFHQRNTSDPSILMRCFVAPYGSQTYSDSVGDFPFDWLTSIRSFNAFGSFYLVVTAYNSSNSSNVLANQLLMKATQLNVYVTEMQRWTDLAVTSSTVFKRSTGDVYLCYTVDDIPLSTPGMKIFRFNAVTETFQLQYTVNDTGPHRKCAFVDISGTLFALSDSPSKNTTTLHHLTNNATWQPYRNISSSGPLSGLSVAFSTQANAHMLAFGHGALQRISIYLWSNDTFTLKSTFNTGFNVEFPYLLQIGHDMFLTASYAQPDTTSQLFFCKFNGTDFNLHGSVSNSKPSGGFHHFWFQDNLYLVVLNKFDVFNNTSPDAYNTGNQQLFQVL